MAAKTQDSSSLVVFVIDISSLAWGERDIQRAAQDKVRLAQNKRSAGPAILEDVLESIQALCSAICSIERGAGISLIAVADNESAIVYPRKDELAMWADDFDMYAPDLKRMREDLTKGASELVTRAASRLEKNQDVRGRQAAMAAGFSKALCVINRMLVATRAGGVTALHNEHYLNRDDDEGIIALMGDTKKKQKKEHSVWSPRIMLVQASEDRSHDYNAFMNCTFAAAKQHIIVDGCFLSSGGTKSSSAFLEQACDLTGGVFLAPTGAAQVGGALTEVLLTVFLPPANTRNALNLPAVNKVDFRARCFQTLETVDLAYTCNQCLSIFSTKPKTQCPTCQTKIWSETKKRRKESI